MFKYRCYNGGILHNYKPRYSSNINVEALSKFKSIPIGGLDFLKDNKYEHDICTWCGKVVNSRLNEAEDATN